MADENPAPRLAEGLLPGEDRQQFKKIVRRVTLRIVVGVTIILGAYALMPTEGGRWWWAVLPMTILGFTGFLLVFIRQLRRVARDDFPVLRAVEALVLTVLLFLVLFAAIAVQLEAQTPGSYSESLNKVDGLYFAVTTLATVGYGDITPVTTPGRVIGIVQMLGNLALLGVAVRLVGKAVERGRGARRVP